MAYADQEMSGNKITAIIIVALIHVVVGYALVTGLAYEAYEKVKEKVTTFDVEEEKPEEEPPPPPPDDVAPPPPIVAPPPPIAFERPAPQIQTQQEIPPQAPPVRVVVPEATGRAVEPPPPPPPPPPAFKPQTATPKGNPGNWATSNDYPSRALREEREGTTRFSVTIGADGRVTGCSITGSSGHPDLDDATCKNITRRARFNPAKDGNGQPTTGTYSNSVRWQIPK